jgi:hypothetical protein
MISFLCKPLLCYTCMLSLNDKAQNYTLVSWIIQYILVGKGRECFDSIIKSRIKLEKKKIFVPLQELVLHLVQKFPVQSFHPPRKYWILSSWLELTLSSIALVL